MPGRCLAHLCVFWHTSRVWHISVPKCSMLLMTFGTLVCQNPLYSVTKKMCLLHFKGFCSVEWWACEGKIWEWVFADFAKVQSLILSCAVIVEPCSVFVERVTKYWNLMTFPIIWQLTQIFSMLYLLHFFFLIIKEAVCDLCGRTIKKPELFKHRMLLCEKSLRIKCPKCKALIERNKKEGSCKYPH